jgi:hypothetical protein
MTKTTSYEISKKLKEAGFDVKSDFYWVKTEKNNIQLDFVESEVGCFQAGWEYIEAYDLETLLDALPDSIPYKEYRNTLWYYLFLRNNTVGYYYECNEYMDNYRMGDGIFEFSKLSPNESLADTAGRMWLMLKEKGII